MIVEICVLGYPFSLLSVRSAVLPSYLVFSDFVSVSMDFGGLGHADGGDETVFIEEYAV